ncbi:zinc ribbon domain-containing protein [Flavobacterium pectinovorum]|uniref:zinc ribbon domain-containing protein n=1 Tax=Flavobacterium pectinovorum TaxID=29533 RepID=UPI001FAD727F|nr:zinc ribbon domain-containing protein [Flavobacterium pectinovorum]MCI9844517.1 zinc ribbon domain-containing protein [Flavobacterium pectinovorum]
MALINCKECNAKISDNAKSCPNCGNPNLKQEKSNRFTLILFGIIVTIFMLFIMFGGNNMSHENIELVTAVDTSAVAYAPKLTAEGRKENIEKIRNMFLDTGIDVKVSVYGKNNETLELEYALFNDVWYRKFETSGMFDNFHKLGFKKIILNDNYDYKTSVTY